MAVATTGSITIQQLFRYPTIMKLISRIRATGNPISSYYRIGLGDNASEVVPAGMRTFGYDLYDNTRRIAGVTAPKSTATRKRQQKVGTATGTLMRSHESLPIAWEDIVNMRPPGARIGTLDRTGQGWVGRQMKTMVQTYMNLREWTTARMFRGGFAIKYNGNEHYLVETGAGDKDVTYNLPSSHTAQINAPGSDIITASWATASTNIPKQLLEINKNAMRETGWPIEIIWINSTTLGHLLFNTTLQAVGGTSFRIWETMEWKQMTAIDGSSVYSGMDVRFRALPQFLFKVYDGVLQKGGALADSVAAAEVELVIPDNKAIMTPRPGEWIGFAEGQEPITKTHGSQMEILTGFQTWQRPTLEPSGVELMLLDNFLPVAYNPAAWYFPTVIF